MKGEGWLQKSNETGWAMQRLNSIGLTASGMIGMRSAVVKKYETAKKFKRVIVNGRGANNKSQLKRRALE